MFSSLNTPIQSKEDAIEEALDNLPLGTMSKKLMKNADGVKIWVYQPPKTPKDYYELGQELIDKNSEYVNGGFFTLDFSDSNYLSNNFELNHLILAAKVFANALAGGEKRAKKYLDILQKEIQSIELEEYNHEIETLIREISSKLKVTEPPSELIKSIHAQATATLEFNKSLQRLTFSEKEVKERKREMVIISNKISENEKQIIALNASLNATKKELRINHDNSEKLKITINNLYSKQYTNKEELSIAQATLSSLNKQLKTTGNNQYNLKTKKVNLRVEISNLESSLKLLSEKLSHKKKLASTLEEKLNNIYREHTNLSMKKETAAERVQSLANIIQETKNTPAEAKVDKLPSVLKFSSFALEDRSLQAEKISLAEGQKSPTKGA